MSLPATPCPKRRFSTRSTEPADLRKLPRAQLRQLADELRQETISAVSVTGGHLGAGLGVVELTVALHYVFDTPRDKLDLGRGPPGLSAQDYYRTPRPHAHAAAGRRAFRFHQAQREHLRPVRRRAFLDVDFRRPGFRRRARPEEGDAQRRLRDRRRRDERRHGL